MAIADKQFAWLPAAAALMVALLLQIAVNLANDYFDYVKGIDTEDRLGPPRVTQSGLVPARQVKRAMLLTIGISLLDILIELVLQQSDRGEFLQGKAGIPFPGLHHTWSAGFVSRGATIPEPHWGRSPSYAGRWQTPPTTAAGRCLPTIAVCRVRRADIAVMI